MKTPRQSVREDIHEVATGVLMGALLFVAIGLLGYAIAIGPYHPLPFFS